jgi:hypothetical protein
MDLLADDADMDSDGLTNAQERAFLGDPAESGSPEILTMQTAEDGTRSISFRCATGPGSPRICLQSSEDLTGWRVETSCARGSTFTQPAEGNVVETPSQTGRTVTFSPNSAPRKFWRVVVDP